MSSEFDLWKADRKSALESEHGWLNLIARLHLPTGTHSIGTDPASDLVLPAGPAHLGEVIRSGDGVSLKTDQASPTPFTPVPGGFPQLEVGSLLLEFHDPGDDPALRVRDLSLSTEISLDYFPFDPEWIVEANWVPLDHQRSIEIGQAGGSDISVLISHEARFEHHGHEVRLTPTHWKSGKPMFVIRDATSGTKTYGASRFLIAQPAQHGKITLDFNRLHNPPCAFTTFAICPLPPPGNILPFPVNAGELLPPGL